jgi:phage baseplate assembly protein W
MTTLRILGKGWGFPVFPDPVGSLEFVEGPDKVSQSIRIILDTDPGERVMRPTFGCGLRRYLMKPNSAATRALIKSDVQIALATWEPRIVLKNVQVDPGDDPSLVLIRIDYVHAQNGQPGNLVYPFYLLKK